MSYVVQATGQIRYGDGEYEEETRLLFQFVFPQDTATIMRVIGLKEFDPTSWDKRTTNDLVPVLSAIVVHMGRYKELYVVKDMFSYFSNLEEWQKLEKLFVSFLGACSLYKGETVQVIS